MSSIFDRLPESPAEEAFDTLLDVSGVRIERIVSNRHSSREGFWYEQDRGEWVLLMRGGATLRLQDPDESVVLRPGDYLWLPPGRRHRIDSTESRTVWLAVHLPHSRVPPA